MEHITIGNHQYNFVSDFKHVEKIRQSFNNLTRRTYAFDFEEWYRSGYWQDGYIPYSLLDDEKVICNVSVNVIDFLVMGEKKKLVQIGTVMTDEAYRHRGLNRFIMERVLEEWQSKCDSIYLFANNTVLNFYPKFGFVKMDEYQHSTQVEEPNSNKIFEKLNMSNDKHIAFLCDKIKVSVPASRLAMRNNVGLVMFYCTSYMSEQIYYIKALDTIVIAETDHDILYLHDVFSDHEVSINDIISAMVEPQVNRVVFGFTPQETSSYDVNLLQTDDTTLFVLDGKNEFIEKKHVMFPVLSHA